MADETTAFLGLVKPEVNGEQTENVWGYDLNANFDKIDAQFALLPASDAPLDGDIYGRRQGAWSRTVLATDFAQLQLDFDIHTHPAADITDFAEAVDDRVAAVLTAGANIVLTYDDAANQLLIASTASGSGGGGGLPPDGDYGDIVVSASGTHWTLDLTDVTLPTGDYGDITVSPGKVWTIDPGVVTYTKIQNVGANKLLGAVTAGTVTEITCTAAGRALIADADAAAQRTTLGLGTAATANTTAFQPADPTLTALSALDGASGLLEVTSLDFFARRTIGVGTAASIPDRAAADTRYAPIDSPAFTGDARAVTPATSDNDTSIATTAFIRNYLASVEPPADGNEYVRRNGVWRLKEQNFDLVGKTRQDVTVPTGARQVSFEGSLRVFAAGARYVAVQLSVDGTTFLAGATDYTYTLPTTWSGSGGFTPSTSATGAHIVLANLHDNAQLAMNISVQIELVSLGFPTVKAFSTNLYTTNPVNMYGVSWAYGYLGRNGPIKALRVFTTGDEVLDGSHLNVRWIY